MSEAKGVLFSLGQFLNQFLYSDCVYTLSILTVYMFCMFSILTVYTLSILTVYTLSIMTVDMFCMFSILTVYTLSILTVYTLSILTVYPLSILTVYLNLLLLFSDFLSDECSVRSNRLLYNGLFQTCSDGVTPTLSWSVVNLTLGVE